MASIRLNTPAGRLAAEFLLIVAGVLVALMVDAWLEGRRDAEQRRQYLVRLSIDLQADLENIEHRLVFFTGVRAEALQTLRALQSDAEVTTDDVLAAFYAAENFDFSAADGTWQDLLSTGNIRLLDDIELRLSLNAYYGQNSIIMGAQDSTYRARVRGIIPASIQSDIREHCPTTDGEDRVPSGFPPCEVPGFTVEQANVTYDRLRQYPQIDELLTYRLSELDVLVYLLDVYKRRLLATQQRLQGNVA